MWTIEVIDTRKGNLASFFSDSAKTYDPFGCGSTTLLSGIYNILLSRTLDLDPHSIRIVDPFTDQNYGARK
jgi:hypothetical protein